MSSQNIFSSPSVLIVHLGVYISGTAVFGTSTLPFKISKCFTILRVTDLLRVHSFIACFFSCCGLLRRVCLKKSSSVSDNDLSL